MDDLYHHLKPKPPQSVGLPCDNLNETINTVKQKLRERKVSETNVDHMGSPVSDFPDDGVTVKASERRRIEHTKLPYKPASTKKMDKKETNACRVARLPSTQHSPTSTYQKKTELMRRKILKQLFRMDNPTMRKIVNQPMSSSKYDFALNSLIKETRSSVSNQLRSLAEKSLSFHATNADSLQGKQIVQDTFMGHLGTMLDIDASVELSNMEPQVIAELSKVLQEDLMGNLNEEMSTSLANAVQDSVSEDAYSSTSDFPNYLNDDQSVQNNTFGYNTSGKAYFHANSSNLPLENTSFSNDRNTNKRYLKTTDTHCTDDTYNADYQFQQCLSEHKTERVDCFSQSENNFGSNSYSELSSESPQEGITNDAYEDANFQRSYSGSNMKTYSRRKNDSNSPSQYFPCDNPEVGENRYSRPRSAYNSQHVKVEDRTCNDGRPSSLADNWTSVDYQHGHGPSQETTRDESFANGSHFPPHSKSPLNAALNNNCDSSSYESVVKTDTSSNVGPQIPDLCPKPVTITTVSAATSNLGSNLRKRKISDSHSTLNSNKKPDISECGISVRKDIFPEDPKLEPLNMENNSCDITISSSENMSEPLLSKPSPESCEKLPSSLPTPEKLVKSSDEKKSEFYPETSPKPPPEKLNKTSSESKSSIQKLSKSSCEKVPKTCGDKLSRSSPDKLSKSPPENLTKSSKEKLSTLSPEQSQNPPPIKLSKSSKEKLPEQSTKSFPELISTSSQTRCVILKSQSSQYIPAILRSSDASSQVYESLICSKSKGVQCTKPSARDRSCQTLKVGGLSPAFHTDINKTDHLCHRETQTDEILAVVKTETISVSSDKEIVKISKIKPLEKFRTLEHNCKPEEVLEKMRQIDNDIQQLMEEKLKLYNMLDVSSAGMDTNSVVPSSSSSSSGKGKHLEKLRFQKYDRELQKRNHNHGKFVDKPILKCSPIHNASRTLKPRSSKDKASTSDASSNHQKRNASQSEHHKTKEPHSKHKNSSNEIKSSSDDHKNISNEHKNNSHEHKNKNVSNNALKSKSKPIPPRSDRSKHSIKKNISDKPEVEYSNCSANNIIPGKDINNCKNDLVKGQVDLCNNVAPEAGNGPGSLEVNSDTKYVDSAGCPLPLDCNFVVFEEIVIKSEDDRVNDPSSSADSRTISKSKKKPDIHKKNRTLRSGNSSSKLDKSDCDKVAVKTSITKLPPALPIIKIRRKRTSSTSSQSQNKASPLFNLISQLNDTDEECDFEISPQKESKPSTQTSNKSESTEPTGTNLGVLEKVPSAECTLDTEENPKYDLVDCRVYLERLDSNTIVTPVHESKVITNSDNVCAPLKDFEENYDPTIMNDETLFVTKGYGNDDDCISLEQLDAVQFDDFCDPDGPSIIGNIQVNDSFSIIDQWDSKLFEDVSLLEDREIFSDKNLMDGFSTNTEPDNSSQEKSNSAQNEGNAFQPINCTSHTDSIIALKVRQEITLTMLLCMLFNFLSQNKLCLSVQALISCLYSFLVCWRQLPGCVARWQCLLLLWTNRNSAENHSRVPSCRHMSDH